MLLCSPRRVPPGGAEEEFGMSSFRNGLLGAVVATLASIGAANAALIIDSTLGGAPTGVNVTRENFNSLTLGGTGGFLPGSGTTVSVAPNAQVVQGSTINVHAAPFLSGSNGVGFGSPNQSNGPDATTYLVTGSTSINPGAGITLQLGGFASYFGLLWGSIDASNTLSFFSGDTSVGTVTGSDIVANPNGSQDAEGTRYVNITSTTLFDRVVFTSSAIPFEFDNVAFTRENPQVVPEPASLALFGAGLLGFGLLRRRRQQG
jgi:hypothetical protein